MRSSSVVLCCGLVVACAPAPSPDPDGGPADAGGGDQDGGSQDAGGGDAGPGPDDGGSGPLDGGPNDAGPSIDNPYGLHIRHPASHELDCDIDGVCPFTASDIDYLCTLSVDGHDAIVYLRATPTDVEAAFFPLPVFDDVRAFVAEDGVVVEVPASYDYGGNHHNDFFRIELDGVLYTYDHSTYGFGFRACQPPDCLKREEGMSYIDGCQPRTLPETCVAVAEPLPSLDQPFMLCPGDDG